MFASNGTEQLQHYWILRSRLDYMTSNNYRIRMTVHSLCLVLRLTATAASYPFHKRRRSGKLSIMILVSNVSNNAVIRNWLYRMVKHKWYKSFVCIRCQFHFLNWQKIIYSGCSVKHPERLCLHASFTANETDFVRPRSAFSRLRPIPEFTDTTNTDT